MPFVQSCYECIQAFQFSRRCLSILSLHASARVDTAKKLNEWTIPCALQGEKYLLYTLLPAMTLAPVSPSLTYEAWALLSLYPYQARFRFYADWRVSCCKANSQLGFKKPQISVPCLCPVAKSERRITNTQAQGNEHFCCLSPSWRIMPLEILIVTRMQTLRLPLRKQKASKPSLIS